jgi:histidinol-phosphatase
VADQGNTFTLAQDLELALKLADLADAISLKRYQANDLIVETKPDLSPVTDADKAVENAIRSELASARSPDLIVGEEFGQPDSLDLENLPDGKRYWVIDPIDGTKNFLRGVPTWATLIGLCNSKGEVIVGVVSAPALSRRWHASSGGGAFVTHDLKSGSVTKKISVSKVSKLADASISYSDLIGWGNSKEKFIGLQEKIWRTRGLGDFWSHMLVAEGAVDLSVEPKLALWDMAALEIIVREAGGRFTNTLGKAGVHGGSAVSSNGLLHEAFLNEVFGK